MENIRYYCYNTGEVMKNILIILGILVFINILIITANRVFAHESEINFSTLNIFHIETM